MADSYDLSKLGEHSFEHMVNFLAMKVLGPGVTTFGPGADGGRDGFFRGIAPYPSEAEKWSGVWYIQSKFHRPHLTKNAQAWVLEQIDDELQEFSRNASNRNWPDIWIFATNVDISAVPDKGTFDKAQELVRAHNPKLAGRFHIWSGNKILGLLNIHNEVATQYLHLLTPGHVLSNIYNKLSDETASIEEIARYLIVNQFDDQQYTKLEQAGSSADSRPGIQKLFIDLPYQCTTTPFIGMAAENIAHSLARNHRIDTSVDRSDDWQAWARHPRRSRIWFIKAGPGQGKSTIGQYLCQIQRAAFILGENAPRVNFQQGNTARDVRDISTAQNLWPSSPRLPVYIELKDYSQWISKRKVLESTGILAYLTDVLSSKINKPLLAGTLKRALSAGKWMFVFDGLDEVPSNLKDPVAQEVTLFIDNLLIEVDADALAICTSRPQGYSGQFSDLHAAVVVLSDLNSDQALKCARPILQLGRTEDEAHKNIDILQEALSSQAITEIMKTPLQCHIMAVVVRDGGRPPERRWQLYDNFYKVVKKREAAKASPNYGLAILLRDGDKLIKALHNKLGFELHKSAELGEGSDTSLSRTELQAIVYNVTSALLDDRIAETSEILLEATTDRLVLVNTPETTDKVRFDVRQLQEFFAGEFIYEGVDHALLLERLGVIAADQHWREVMHFVLSAIIENRLETNLAVAVTVLNEIDSADDADLRIYRRRLAIGGLIAVRLLFEGVLEQDKKDRQHFRACFNTILASADSSLVYSLMHVRGLQSRAWLREIAVDHLLDQSPAETLGAAYLCAHILPEDYRRLSLVKRYFEDSTISYKIALFTMIPASRSNPSSVLSRWALCFVVDFLLSTDSSLIQPSLLSNLITILDIHPDTAEVLANRLNVDIDSIRHLLPFFADGVRHDTRQLPIREDERLDPLVIHHYDAPSKLRTDNWPLATWKLLENLTGSFSILYKCIDCYRAETQDALFERLETLSESLLNFPLPTQWQILLPPEISFSYGDFALGLNFWKSTVGKQVIAPFTLHALSLTGTRSSGANDLGALLSRFPSIVFDYMMSARKLPDYGVLEQLQTPGGAMLLLETFRKNPSLFRHMPHRWGQFISLHDDTAADFRALVSQCKDGSIDNITTNEIYPFEVNLPGEIGLLPVVLNVVVQAMWHVEYDVYELEESSLTRRVSARATISTFIPNAETLLDLVHDGSTDLLHKSCAAMLYLMHPSDNKHSVDICLTSIIDGYLENSPWYLKAACSSLIDQLPNDPLALKAVGKLLDMSRSDFLGRIEMNNILAVWRERSSEPVSRAMTSIF